MRSVAGFASCLSMCLIASVNFDTFFKLSFYTTCYRTVLPEDPEGVNAILLVLFAVTVSGDPLLHHGN